MYISCIDWILNEKKSAPFAEHSPTLYDISAVAKWEKVAQGMVKMYCAEVLGKLPVIRHFYFGTILKYN